MFPGPRHSGVPSMGGEGSFTHHRRGATLKATILLHGGAGRGGRDWGVAPSMGSSGCKLERCHCVRWIYIRVSAEGRRSLFASSARRKENVVTSPASCPAAGTCLCPALGNGDSILRSQRDSIPKPIHSSAVQKPPSFPKGRVLPLGA